ncbi:MAG: bifunctional DNA-binding transcriptional regulator/O6-methylguanine-DNA methyltransferase Ada [Pseudomonadota bacterium]
MSNTISDDEAWAAVMRRDRAYDGHFFTGVLSTGIYCRPSCPARHPLRENVRFFATIEEAEAAGLRACKRCRPNEIARDESAVQAIIGAIRQSLTQMETAPKLDDLAQMTGYSPTHLQKLFKRETGLSPAAYARALRAERAKDVLGAAARVSDAIYDAGYSGPSRFYAEQDKRLGMTASAWKDGGAGAIIHWAIVESYLGPMLVAATDKGVCRLSFNEGEAQLKARFPNATLDKGGEDFAALVQDVVAAVEHPARRQAIPLDVQGTAFQEAVWQELQRIPPGETRSYAELAAAVGKPKAYRAAGSANGANNVAVLIPCHRVIASDGSLGGYAYGLEIKRKLLEAEQIDKA